MRTGRRTKPAGQAALRLAAGLVVAAAAGLLWPAPASRSPRPVAIVGGTVLTMAGSPIEGGVVLIEGGKIVAVGRDLELHAGTEVIDARGRFVMPGLIDAMTYYGVRPQALNDRDDPVTPENRIVRAYYPFGELLRGPGGIVRDREILSGGVTAVYIAPGDQQAIGGQGAVVKTWAESLGGWILREPAAIDMAVGDPPLYDRASASSGKPINRMGLARLIRQALSEAGAYARKSPPPSRDPGLEALGLLLDRKIPARIEADFSDDIRTALRLSEEYDFDLIVDSGLGAHRVKDELARRGVPVVLGPPSHPFVQGGEVSMTAELYGAMNEENAKELIEAGVKTAIASFGFSFGPFGEATQGRWLLLEAAYLTGYGVSDEAALKMLTINAAEILGVADRIGSLEAGKDADVIILGGPPLSVRTWVDQVFIDGTCVYTREGEVR